VPSFVGGFNDGVVGEDKNVTEFSEVGDFSMPSAAMLDKG